MGAGADDLPLLHNNDLIRVDDGGEAVGNDDYRAILCNRVECFAHALLVDAV